MSDKCCRNCRNLEYTDLECSVLRQKLEINTLFIKDLYNETGKGEEIVIESALEADLNDTISFALNSFFQEHKFAKKHQKALKNLIADCIEKVILQNASEIVGGISGSVERYFSETIQYILHEKYLDEFYCSEYR